MAVFGVQTILPVSGLTNLQSLSGSAGDIAIAAGYWAAGDGGGGQFYFEPASGSTTVTSVTQAHAHIDSTSFVASPITVTAAGHPFVTGQAVLLSGTGGADGTWIVTRIDANSFTLNGSIGYSVTPTMGGDANSVTVTTALPHGRAVGQRLAIVGAGWSPPTASSINGQWDNLGVTGPTTLTIGASLTGSYSVGGACGDNGFSVPTTSGSSRWVRIQQSPNNPRYFGAKGDSTSGVDGSDDAPAFAAALSAMPLGGTLFIPPPSKTWYRLGSDLTPDRPARIVGPGKGVPCLSFDQGKGIRLRNSNQTWTGQGAKGSVLSDLFIQGTYVALPEWAPTSYCVGDRVRSTLANPANSGLDTGVHYRCVKEILAGARSEPAWKNLPLEVTPDGVGRWMAEDWSTIIVTDGLVTIERCRIQPSTDNGIHLRGMQDERTNANACTVRDCFLYQGAAHGIFIRGRNDAQACVTECNVIQAFRRGAAIYDAGFLGNLHLANDAEAGLVSYVGQGLWTVWICNYTVWICNYKDDDTGRMMTRADSSWPRGSSGFLGTRLLMPLLWLDKKPPTIFDGESWYVVKVAGTGPGQRITQVFGSAAPVVSKLSRRDRSGTIEKFIDNDPDDPGGYYSRRNEVDATPDSYDGGEDWTSEGSLYLPFRRRFRQGFYLGTASQGLRPIWITSHIRPPGPRDLTTGPSDLTADLTICGRLLWDKGSIVLNRLGVDPTPGWVATRRGGWGGGRHGHRYWTPRATTILIGEGIEPSPEKTTGKVYRLLRFEVFVSGAWVRDDRSEAILSDAQPDWPRTDGATIPEPLLDSTHRIIWECWGDVGMTWAILPAPAPASTVIVR